MEFDPKNIPSTPQKNTHGMSAYDVRGLGNLLSGLGRTLLAASGRLDRFDEKHHGLLGDGDGPGRGIDMRSPSALNDATEALCLHAWNIRNSINNKVGVNELPNSDEIDAWTLELAALTDAKKATSDPVLAKALQTSIVRLLERIDKAQENTGEEADDDYLKPMKQNVLSVPSTIHEENEIDVLMGYFGGDDDHAGEIFGNVGKQELRDAIRRLKREGITHLYQLLNTPKPMILDIVADKGDDDEGLATEEVLTEILHSYGYKWRTDGNTRFDLPVARFGFSREAYRTRSERRAATAILNAAKGKKGAEGGSLLRDAFEYVFKHAHAVASATYKDNNITTDELVDDWFGAVNFILTRFKGIIPERLWLVEIEVKPAKGSSDEPMSTTRFLPRLADAIKAAREREVVLREEQKGKGSSLTTTFFNNDISDNSYLPEDGGQWRPQRHKMCSTHSLVHVITRIIFEFVYSMELNAMQDRPTVKELGDIWVWDTALSQYGWMPLTWRVQNMSLEESLGSANFPEPEHFFLTDRIKLGDKLKYRSEKHT